MSTKIGVDVDGVVATFWPFYEQLHIDVSGKDNFGEKRYPAVHPQSWDWPQRHFGYTKADEKAVWKIITRDPEFWNSLWPLPDATEACLALSEIEAQGHEVTFITSRPGINARRQTQDWLIRHGMERPTVIVASDKDAFVNLMGLDAYIDDRLLNANMVMKGIRERQQLTRMYLVEQDYNKRPVMDLDPEKVPPITEWDEWRDPALIVVKGVREALRAEDLI